MSDSLKQIPKLFKNSFILLRKNDPLILASATAFFTLFSLSPILLILANFLSIFFQNNPITEQLFATLEDVFGEETTDQISTIVQQIRQIDGQSYITVGSFLFVVFVATNLMRIVKQAIHRIWRIRKKPQKRLRYNLLERLTSVGLILIIGLLFLVSLLLDTSLNFLQGYVGDLIPSVDAYLIRAANALFSLIVVTAWFMILYKILPDAHVHWKVAITGGLITAVLFSLGKWILGMVLNYNNIVTVFGASASFVLILLFIFYSALILYFGAAFTYLFAQLIHMPIRAGKHSERYELSLLSKDQQD